MKKTFSIILSMILIFSSFVELGDLYSYAAEDFTPIYTVDDLYAINNNMSGNYKLMNDIDMSDATGSGGDWNFMGNGWEPIGSGGNYSNTPFTGNFDGNGFSIREMRISIDLNTLPSGTGYPYLGLFSSNAGNIKNLCFENCTINENTQYKNSYVGFISATNSGLIENCYIKNGEITGHLDSGYQRSAGYYSEYYGYIGGLTGQNTGMIKNCGNSSNIYFTSESDGSDYEQHVYIGGISGSNTNGTIMQSFNSGNCQLDPEYGYGSVGGISGTSSYGKSGQIQECFNTGEIITKVTSTKKPGLYGIAGGYDVCDNCYNIGQVTKNDNSTCLAIASSCNNCYYLNETGASSSNAQALTNAQMKIALCYSNFDFENTWLIDPDSDYPYPQLRENRQDNKDIELVAIESAPTKDTYFTGSEIDPTGGKFEVYYKDGSSKVIDMTKTMLSGYDMSEVGIQTVTANYRGFEKNFNITVMKKPNLVSLTLTSQPNTKEFVKGTKFDFTGAQAKAVYDDGTQETIDITPEMTTGGNVNILGDQTISFEHDGETVTFDVKVIPVKVTSIEVASNPTKTTYVEGKAVSTDGLTIKAHYNNGTENLVTGFEVGEIPTTVGTHDVEVSFSGCTTTFQIKIVAKTAVSLSIKTDPNKVSYVFGQKFDPTGMVVEATFDNGDVLEVTDYTVGDLPTTTGYSLIPVTYQNTTAYFTVNMKEKALESIQVKKLPDKVTYVEGEQFTDSGMKIVAVYNDGEEKTVTDYTLTGTSTKSAGDKTVTVLYEGLTTSFNIKVLGKTVTGLEVTPPDKTVYIEGEEFDDTGLVVKAVYDNGKSETVTGYELSGFGDSDETNVIVVSYGGKAKSFVVSIHKPVAEWEITTPASCTIDGEKVLRCDTCGEVIKTDVIPATDHDWGEWTEVTGATCTEKGSKKHICKVCTTEEFADIDAKNHDFDSEYTIDKQPTCSEAGIKSRHCRNDGCEVTTDVTEIEPLPHNEKSVATPATTEEDGSMSVSCTTCKATLSNTVIKKIGNIELLDTSFVYDGSEKKPQILVTDSINHALIEGEDYDVSYSSNVNAGEARAIVTFKGKYDGTVVKKFTIDALPLDDTAINLSSTEFAYNGSAQKPTVLVDGLTRNKDYTVEYSDSGSEDAGKYTVTVNGIGNYKGTEKLSYKIARSSVSALDIRVSSVEFVYSGLAQRPIVQIDGLTKDKDYTIEYSDVNSCDVGTYDVSISGCGNYEGTETFQYVITGKLIKNAEVKVSNYAFTGSQIKPNVVLTYEGKTLVEDVDYEILKYGQNIYPGIGTVRIEGMGDFQGKMTVEFNIGVISGLKVTTQKNNSIAIAWTKQAKANGYKVYADGKLVTTISKPKTVKYTISGLKSASEHSVYVTAFKKATVSGTATTFESAPCDPIVTTTLPDKGTISGATTSGGSISVTWNKLNGSGYEVWIANNTKYNGKTVFTTDSSSVTSTTFDNLVANKVYYIKVRPVLQYDGKTYYGTWSANKKITCK